jgi:signal transduction histidine kinase
LSPVLPINESSRELIIEVARALQPQFPAITAAWREQVSREFGFDPRTQAALKRLTLDTGCSYFCQGEFAAFFENVSYFAGRLAKLNVDTRAVDKSLQIYQAICVERLSETFAERRAEAVAALEMLRSAIFVNVAGAYFDAKTAETQALLSILEAELSAADLAGLLKRALEVTAQTFGASTGAVLLKDSDAQQLALAAEIGLDEVDRTLAIPLGQGFSGRIAQNNTPELVLDTHTEANILSPTFRERANTLWGVPVSTAASGVVGVLMIGFDTPYYEWLPREHDLMRALADRSALAIERARMTEALREREALIADLSGHLLRGQEDERKRISRELHDDTGQGMMVIRLYLSMLEKNVKSPLAKEKLRETLEVVDRTVVGLRRTIAKLSPLVLEELGLAAALRKEAKELEKAAGVKTEVSIAPGFGRLQPEKEAAIYRVVQEALHNIAKHAQAHNATVQLSRDGDKISTVVEDDGVGMQKSGKRKPGGDQSFGLAGIRERVSTFGGTFRICSTKGQGTRIEVSVPATEAPAPQPVGQPFLVHSATTPNERPAGSGTKPAAAGNEERPAGPSMKAAAAGSNDAQN